MLWTSKNIKSPSGLLATPSLCILPLHLHAKCCMASMIYGGPYCTIGIVWPALPPMCILPLHRNAKYAMVFFGIVYYRIATPHVYITWYINGIVWRALPPMCILPLHQDAKCPLLKFTVCHSLFYQASRSLLPKTQIMGGKA